MPVRNPKNPINSTCLQSLQELKTAGFDIPDTLISAVKSNQVLLRRADQALAAKVYPDKKIRFVQVQLDVLPLLASLDGNAQALYFLLALNAGTSGLVSISLDSAAAYLSIGKAKVRGLLERLVALGLIAVHTPGIPRHPAIYCVNPEYAVIGKGRGPMATWAAVPKPSPAHIPEVWGHEHNTLPDGTRYNHIVPLAPVREQKQAADSEADLAADQEGGVPF